MDRHTRFGVYCHLNTQPDPTIHCRPSIDDGVMALHLGDVVLFLTVEQMGRIAEVLDKTIVALAPPVEPEKPQAVAVLDDWDGDEEMGTANYDS